MRKSSVLQNTQALPQWWLVYFPCALGACLMGNTNAPSAGAICARNLFARGMQSNMLSAKRLHFIVWVPLMMRHRHFHQSPRLSNALTILEETLKGFATRATLSYVDHVFLLESIAGTSTEALPKSPSKKKSRSYQDQWHAGCVPRRTCNKHHAPG